MKIVHSNLEKGNRDIVLCCSYETAREIDKAIQESLLESESFTKMKEYAIFMHRFIWIKENYIENMLNV